MKIEIFTLCDHAADYGGKICISGAFDRVQGKEAPVTIRSCTVCARLRFDPSEEGAHKIRISFMDADAKAVVPALTGDITLRFGERDRTHTVNVIMNFHNLKLPNFGEYAVEFAVGTTVLATLPLYFDPAAKPPA